jgi:GNAT superfamily N-acetyltransferase
VDANQREPYIHAHRPCVPSLAKLEVAPAQLAPILAKDLWKQRWNGSNAMAREWREGTYLISDDAKLLCMDVIHEYLAQSYWSGGISREILERGIANSLPFGVYDGAHQVGFARVVSDYATFAYLADVFVLESHRGRGLSKRLMEVIRSHPKLQGLRRWHLVTRDAHGLYRQYGFNALAAPERHMESLDPNVYANR